MDPDTSDATENFFYMRRDHPEWDLAWDRMAADGINAGLADPFGAWCKESGECWQYMGSVRDAAGNRHDFRHRHHPAVNRRVTKQVFIKGGE